MLKKVAINLHIARSKIKPPLKGNNSSLVNKSKKRIIVMF